MSPATEIPRCRTSGELLLLIEGSAIAFAFVLSLLAMLMFMMITIADRVDTLIKEQNTAALKLSDELQYFRDHRLQNDHSVPPGLFSDLVEFSRNTAIIKNEVDRLLSLELIWKQPLHKSEVDDPSSYHVDPNTDGD